MNASDMLDLIHRGESSLVQPIERSVQKAGFDDLDLEVFKKCLFRKYHGKLLSMGLDLVEYSKLPLQEVFDRAIGFLNRNLRKIQVGKEFNVRGVLEVPILVLVELLINAMVHRDYFIHSSIKLFIFDNRIEIISPGPCSIL